MPIIDADEYDGQIVIVSEYAPDGSLDEWLKTHGAMPVEKAVETTIKILDGLEFLHARNIIHRDLKPANILLQGDTPRLADFGISRALRSTATSQSSNISGTFAYMPPEGFDGKRSVQTDVWSVGVNLYQFLTGSLPFPQKEPSALIAAIMMRDFEPLPPHVPQNLQNAIAKALSKQSENRYASAAAMREDLRRILRGEAVADFIQPDSPQTFPAEQVTQIRKNAPFSANNSQYENETVVRSAPRSKKSNLNNQERQVVSVPIQAEMKNPKKDVSKVGSGVGSTFFTVMFLVVLGILSAGGYFFYQKYQEEQQYQEEQLHRNYRNNYPSYDASGDSSTTTNPTNQNSSTSNSKPTVNVVENSTPEKIPTAKIVARFVWMGASFSAPIQNGSVTVSSNGKSFKKKTSNQGWLVLDGVPCNQKVTFSFGEDGVMSRNPGEETMTVGDRMNQSSKLIKCSNKPVPVGLFSWETGEFMGDDMDNVDGCFTCQ